MLLVIIGAGLAGLAALPHGKAFAQNITSDTYFYGDSPPVYPSPNMTGTGSWATAFSKAQALVGQMTLDEKINLTAGISADSSCSGIIPAIPRLGFPGLCLSDAGNGLRSTDYVSSWPSGVHVGASFNKELTLQRGIGQGGEFKRKGVNVALGPVVGPLGRVSLGGRNWEGFSNDPYLGGALVYQHVTGVQSAGVITSTKHYIGYEQETNRNPSGDVQSVSSNIDDQTMHELYLWPFQDAVLAGSGNVMCSYNRINNSYACANSKTLNGLLKTELGFQGFVVSDWGAQHAGVATALAGLDMTMPDAAGFWGPNLTMAVMNGSVPESRINDMATRIVASWYQMGQDQDFPAPGIGMPLYYQEPHQVVDGRNTTFSKPVLLQGAIEGHVLVKNTDNALPLQAPRLLSIFGYSAKNPDQNDIGLTTDSVWNFGGESFNGTEELAGFSSNPPTTHDAVAVNGTLYSGGGSGATSQSLVVAPFDAIVQRAYEDDTQLFWDFTSGDPVVDPTSDACLVFANAFASESWDRPNLHDDYTDGLVLNVAGQCNNTIVVMHNAGIRLVDQFVDHPNVTALVFAHLPGQASGKALVSLLYGDVSPSGKLPYTVAHNETDYGGTYAPSLPEGIFAYFPQSNFSEGVFTDYRYFDKYGIAPRYEFGFGLSYTTFGYSDLVVAKATGAGGFSPAAANTTTTTGSNTTAGALFAQYPSGAVAEGGQTDLWDVLATVTAQVSNTGAVAGAEAAQLYVGIPAAGAPVRQLRGFAKPVIAAGASASVTFNLTRRDLSYWDAAAQKWALPRGTFAVYVGASSRDLPLVGELVI